MFRNVITQLSKPLLAFLLSTFSLLTVFSSLAFGENAELSSRLTKKSLAQWVASFEAAAIDPNAQKADDGIVIYLFKKDDDADRIRDRYEQYLEKYRLLQKLRSDVDAKVPDNVIHNSKRTFARCDADGDGKLDAKEVEFLSTISAQKANLVQRACKERPAEIADIVWVTISTGSYPAAVRGQTIEDVREGYNQHVTVTKRITDLRNEFGRARDLGKLWFYTIAEVGQDFVRLQSEGTERVIPLARVGEFRVK